MNSAAESRLPLSRERVLRTAIGFADTHGIEALSMRKLGQALGVEAMSLYNHVANKDDVLDGMLDLVLEEIEVPARGIDWKVSIRASALSAYAVLLRHPWACSQMLSTARVSPARLRFMEGLLRCLREGGFSANMTHHAYHALDSHIAGFTLWVVNILANTDDLNKTAASFVETLSVEEYPYMVEHIHQHLNPPDDEGSEFEFGLNLILDGLERMRDRP
jgi:AcrR family transcriptional regulator